MVAFSQSEECIREAFIEFALANHPPPHFLNSNEISGSKKAKKNWASFQLRTRIVECPVC